jgi:hypothetical protein
MKFNTDRHFTYITARADEHKKQLKSYYKLTEEDLEEITKDWSKNLLIPVDLVQISNIKRPEIVQDIPGPSRTKKTEEVQEIDNASVNSASISPEKGGDGKYLNDKEVEHKQGDEVYSLKKRKGYPLKLAS